MRKVNKYKSKLFCGKGATCWIVIDLKCKIYNKKEYIIINRYSKGKIIKDYSYKYSIVQFDNGITIKLNKRFILINLPDVMQKEVIYSITNATSALYNINGSNIPEITGEVLYPNIADNDGLKVPLMYRTAEKLYKAESDFLKQGLTIKIYDSYRPYKVTKYLYEKTLKIADKHTDVLNRVINSFQYSQRWFLAEHYSSHNYGVAVDMTLVNMEKNEELQMQTYMHNLSVFSVIEYNNEIFGVENGDIEGLLSGFTRMNFMGVSNQTLKIKRSYGIMEKDLLQDFSKADKNDVVLSDPAK